MAFSLDAGRYFKKKSCLKMEEAAIFKSLKCNVIIIAYLGGCFMKVLIAHYSLLGHTSDP
jgi:hypothetical protein